jgi:hypothetical protein
MVFPLAETFEQPQGHLIALPLFELALVLVRLDHVAVRIVHASYKQDVTAEKLRLADCVAGLRPAHRTTTGQMATGPRLNRGRVDTSLSSRVRRRKSGGSAVTN